MQRRKFLVGMGSLAAGGAAVIGTGAQSQEAAYREARFVIEPDSTSPYLKLDAPDTLENGEYASGSNENSGDQLILTFNDEAEVMGDGLNADAEHWFDSVFRVTNHGANTLQTHIDDDALDNVVSGTVLSERVVFYQGESKNGSEADEATSGNLGGASPIEGWPGGAEGPFTRDDDNSKTDFPGPYDSSAGNGYYTVLDPGESVTVGVYIDTRGIETAQDLNPGGDPIVVKGEMG